MKIILAFVSLLAAEYLDQVCREVMNSSVSGKIGSKKELLIETKKRKL